MEGRGRHVGGEEQERKVEGEGEGRGHQALMAERTRMGREETDEDIKKRKEKVKEEN